MSYKQKVQNSYDKILKEFDYAVIENSKIKSIQVLEQGGLKIIVGLDANKVEDNEMIRFVKKGE